MASVPFGEGLEFNWNMLTKEWTWSGNYGALWIYLIICAAILGAVFLIGIWNPYRQNKNMVGVPVLECLEKGIVVRQPSPKRIRPIFIAYGCIHSVRDKKVVVRDQEYNWPRREEHYLIIHFARGRRIQVDCTDTQGPILNRLLQFLNLKIAKHSMAQKREEEEPTDSIKFLPGLVLSKGDLRRKVLVGKKEHLRETKAKSADLFEEGKKSAQVAKELKVPWRIVYQWYLDWKKGGVEALEEVGIPLPSIRFSDSELMELRNTLAKGAKENGFPDQKWILDRIAGVIFKESGMKVSTVEAWNLLRLMDGRHGHPTGDGEKMNNTWEKEIWPGLMKLAREDDWSLLFVGHSGFGDGGSVVAGEGLLDSNPVSKLHFSWSGSVAGRQVNIEGAFIPSPGSLAKDTHVIPVLESIKEKFGEKLLVLWEGFPDPRPEGLEDYLEESGNCLRLEALPSRLEGMETLGLLWMDGEEKPTGDLGEENLVELVETMSAAAAKINTAPKLFRALRIQFPRENQHRPD